MFQNLFELSDDAPVVPATAPRQQVAGESETPHAEAARRAAVAAVASAAARSVAWVVAAGAQKLKQLLQGTCWL